MERKSNFELFRLLLMFLIVMHHCIVHGLGLVGMSTDSTVVNVIRDSDFFVIAALNCLCIVAVNAFVLVSGYFKIKFSPKKVWLLLLLIFIYTIAFTTVPALIAHDFRTTLSSSLFLSHSRYWFLNDYILLMIFAPLLNDFFDKYSKRHQQAFLLVLIFVSAYLGFIWQTRVNTSGYTFFQFVMLYCIGRYIAEYKIALKSSTALIVYFVTAFLNAAMMYGFHHIGQDVYSWRVTYYNNPLIIAGAVALFFCFKNLSFTSPTVNKLAKCSLGIYLFHATDLILNGIVSVVRDFYLAHELWLTILVIFALCLLVCIVSLPIYHFFHKFAEVIYDKLSAAFQKLKCARS